MKLFGNEKPAAEIVTTGYFELERDGDKATLVLVLVHTEIPEQLRGSGVASTLAKTGLDWAREHHMKIDVVCPFVAAFLEKHPEYSDLILR
jgi:uncharacterized protein